MQAYSTEAFCNIPTTKEKRMSVVLSFSTEEYQLDIVM
jgi:hypothetical protein